MANYTQESHRQSSEISQAASRKQLRLRHIAAATVLAVTGGGIGYAVAETSSSPDKHQSAAAIAGSLEAGLNGSGHVAQGAVVEMGYSIPLKNGPKGAVAISNPIKLGKDTYGYIAPSLQDHGKVTIGKVTYTGKLDTQYLGGHNSAYAHEVETPLAIVYDDTDGGFTPTVQRYYSVIMADRGGDTDNLMVTSPNTDYSTYNAEISEQGGEISLARAGDVVYYGK